MLILRARSVTLLLLVDICRIHILIYIMVELWNISLLLYVCNNFVNKVNDDFSRFVRYLMSEDLNILDMRKVLIKDRLYLIQKAFNHAFIDSLFYNLDLLQHSVSILQEISLNICPFFNLIFYIAKHLEQFA